MFSGVTLFLNGCTPLRLPGAARDARPRSRRAHDRRPRSCAGILVRPDGFPLLDRVKETGPEIASRIGADPIELEIADLDGGDGQIIELIRYIRPAGRPIRARSSDPGTAHIAVRVDDLDAALERLRGSQGRQISRRPLVLHDPGGSCDEVTC